MSLNIYLVLAVCICLGIVLLGMPYCRARRKELPLLPNITNVDQIKQLFPKDSAGIQRLLARTKTQVQKDIDAIITVPDNERTFENTVRAVDKTTAGLGVTSAVLQSLSMLEPDDAMRDEANKALSDLHAFTVDAISYNIPLYKSFKSYALNKAPHENLNDEERYFVKETMDDYKRAGLDLPEEARTQIKELLKELGNLAIAFDKNINEDASNISVTKEQLEGLPDDFIEALKRNDDGTYRLGVDYPSYFTVMQKAANEDTRKRLFYAFSNRAYPNNTEILNKIIERRDELARLLGYPSYAHLDIDNEMAKTPEQVERFLNELIQKAHKKEEQEIQRLKQDLPKGVTLTSEGLFKPWDRSYIHAEYKQKHFAIDEQQVAEYFPMENTVKELLAIYEQFFSLTFKSTTITGLWQPEVQLIEVYRKHTNAFLGYLLLDLFPRPNKYSHACQIGIVPATKQRDGGRMPALVIVVANFPKPTDTKPSLLKRSDVITFFHEFGHAIHSLLGATELASFSGTSVKRDFVEMPSQMLEEWLEDRQMLKRVSKHYKTGEPLTEELLDAIQALKHFGTGGYTLRQGYLAKLSLDAFKPGSDKDLDAISQKLYKETNRYTIFAPNTHCQNSFGHLTGYGSKYYGYLWSKVFALDLFETIKKHGLLDPEIGAKYEAAVIGRGGSKDPSELLRDFLGREPNQEAFLRDLGLQ